MKAYIVPAILALSCVSCATVSERTQAWCHDGLVPNAGLGPEISQVVVVPIRTDQFSSAFRLLAKRSVVPIDRHKAAGLAAAGQALNPGSYYLVRSGVFARDGADLSEVKQVSDALARRIFQFRNADRHLSIFNLQGIDATKIHSFPLLVQLHFSPQSSQAYCDTHY